MTVSLTTGLPLASVCAACSTTVLNWRRHCVGQAGRGARVVVGDVQVDEHLVQRRVGGDLAGELGRGEVSVQLPLTRAAITAVTLGEFAMLV